MHKTLVFCHTGLTPITLCGLKHSGVRELIKLYIYCTLLLGSIRLTNTQKKLKKKNKKSRAVSKSESSSSTD